jgi:signal transduction histidine kinase
MLLEALAVRGLTTAHERALRSLGFAEGELAGSGSWLGDGVLSAMMAAAEIDPSVARSVGHRLVAPDAMGIALYGLGLATPEKAYRRVQVLLPREQASSSWVVEEMANGSVRLGFRDVDLGTGIRKGKPEVLGRSSGRSGQPTRGSHRGEAALCALRMGMLEAIPGIYGLLPARVSETSCRFRGSDACRYEVRWSRTSRTGLRIAAGFGAALTLAMLGGSLLLGPLGLSLTASLLGSIGVSIFAVTLGSCYDLHRQLEAVAGARRGHLALFDQVDDALALKLDALARIETKLEADEPVHGRTAVAVESDSSGTEQADLVALLARAIETTEPRLPDGTKIIFDHEDGPILIDCEPVQIEEVVVQLLRNASTASQGLCDFPEILVTLSSVTGGIEFAIEDRGVGIDPSEIDEVFDPFFAERQAGVDEGFGLPVCLRIVERHGGELRMEVEDRAGTRVVVFLPVSKESRQ